MTPAKLYPCVSLYPKAMHSASRVAATHILIRSIYSPTAHDVHATNESKQVSHLQFTSLRLPSSPTTKPVHILTIFSPNRTSPSHCPNRTHKQCTVHPPAHNAHTADISKRVSHLKNTPLRLSSLLAKSSYTHLPLLLQTLWLH